jgi:hypothetical protein
MYRNTAVSAVSVQTPTAGTAAFLSLAESSNVFSAEFVGEFGWLWLF